MPRIPRSWLPDGFFHVSTRGVDGCAIYRDDLDRLSFLALLELAVRVYGWDVYAFCLMTNHYHLVLEADVPSLSAGMQLLNREHAAAFNQRYARTGHLFGDRFTSNVIDSEEYLADAVDYVLANPVRAGLCANVDEYRWSAGAQRRDDRRNDLAEVADHRIVRPRDDRRIRILVDREDPLRSLAADHVLDRAADAARDVELRRDARAGLADLVGVRAPAEVRHDARAADRAAEERRELL